MSKIKCIIEMDEDEYKRVKNAECSYDGFEKGTFGYYLNIIQKTATPIAESNDAVSRQAVLEIVEKNDIIYDAAYRIGKGVKALPPVNPTIIPEDATNGDVIEVMFPNVEINPDPYIPSVDLSFGGILMMRVDRNWWNAKYKGVSE